MLNLADLTFFLIFGKNTILVKNESFITVKIMHSVDLI